MKIDHVAYWVADLEGIRAFYEKYFMVKSSSRYHNPTKNFTSYFLDFPQGNTRLEIMHQPEIGRAITEHGRHLGITHLAISVGSREAVDQMTAQFQVDGFTIHGQPRQTGDGFYESVILDPEGNLIELVAD